MSRISADLSDFCNYNYSVANKYIYLGDTEHDGVGERMAEIAIKTIHMIDPIKPKKKITIFLNTGGGETKHGVAIYDTIKLCKSPVEIRVFGSAESMGAVILQGATDRLISFNSTLMLHYGSSSISGKPKEIRAWQKEYSRQDEWMLRLFLEAIKQKNPNIDSAKIHSILSTDTIFTADEALEIGLVDGIILPGGKIERKKDKNSKAKK